jgi:hypothetical protein
LVNRYLDAIAAGGGNMAPVATDALLVDYTSYAYGVELASALLASARSSARVGSPIVFLELTSDKDSDIAAYLEKLGLSKTTALTALAMVRALCRWFLRCLNEVQMSGISRFSISPSELRAYLDGFLRAAEAPIKQLSAFKRNTRKKAATHNVELWSFASDEYSALLYALMGEMLYHLERDVAHLIELMRAHESEAAGAAAGTTEAIKALTWRTIAVIVSGVGSSARAKALPGVPTISEAGLPGYDMNPWIGVFAPAGTPRAIIDRLNADLVKSLATPEVKTGLLRVGMNAVSTTPEQFSQYIRDEIVKWTKVAKAANIKLE